MKNPAPLFVAAAICCSLPAQWHGEWPMDMTGGLITYDTSGNARDGTLLNFGGNPWVPGVFGNAITFDGVDDYVDSNLQPSIYDGLGSPYSIAYWVKAPAQQNAFVYAEGTIGTSAILIFGSGQYAAQADRFRVYCRNDQGQVPFTGFSNAVVYDNTWHHVAFVDVSGQISLYIDGVLDTANIAYDPTRMPGSPGFGTYSFNTFSMGGLRRGTLCCQMLGDVDDLRLYDFGMSSIDVQLAMAGVPLLPPTGSIGEYGVGCGAGPFDIRGTGSASLGGAGLTIQMQSGPANGLAFMICGFGAPTPTDLGQYGFPGCTGYPANFFSFVVGTLDASGSGTAPTIQIPNSPSLSFVQFNCQAAAVSATAGEFSDLVRVLVGK